METKSTFLKLKQTEREFRRELILDAAVKLFAHKPFSAIGMRDIARQAGISPASIYRYFPSRDAILMEVLGQEIQEGKNKQEQQLQKSTPDLEDVAQGMVDFFMDKDSTLHLLAHFLLKEDIEPETLCKFQEAKDYYLNHFDHIMRQAGVSQSGVRLFSHAFFSSILGLILVFHSQAGQEKAECRHHLHRLAKLTAVVFSKGLR
ncbi:MAG: TetR/AcrR family transcriptional regulator [Desulfovermiculus sp.]|nr:TetR/AcrR family transcriptional regulator [Desulfovermiculus sp.]